MIEIKLEVVVPVSDVDRAKRFYESLGWRVDSDYAAEDFRVVRFTPPGSKSSVAIGHGVTTAVPGSLQGIRLGVANVEAARADLLGRGIGVGEVFHDIAGVLHRFGAVERAPGRDPERRDYTSFASFSDPDGNGWLLQEVKTPSRGPTRASTRALHGRDRPARARS